MKKTLALVLIICCICSMLSGCGSSDVKTNNNSSQASSETSSKASSTVLSKASSSASSNSSSSASSSASSKAPISSNQISSNASQKDEIKNPVELNAVQKLFASLHVGMTRKEVDDYIKKNGLVKYAFVQDSAYYIGADKDAVSSRGRDRKGEAVDINFFTSGNVDDLGKVKSAEYAIHNGMSSNKILKYENGVFYHNGARCQDETQVKQLLITYGRTY